MCAKKNSIRRSQSVSTYGVGSIMDLEDGSSVIICGLEKWKEHECEPITDYRLEKKLKTEIFRMAPDAEFAKNSDQAIPTIRFPRWLYCGQCRYLRNIKDWREKFARAHRNVDFDRTPQCFKCQKGLIPSRFVVACLDGHLDDFPFIWWAHEGKPCGDPELQFKKIGASSALSGLEISCKCGANQKMQGAFNAEFLSQKSRCKCRGSKPWLGEFNGKCGLQLTTLQRGGSNVHFSVVKSSILIPPFSASKLHAEIKASEAYKVISTSDAFSSDDSLIAKVAGIIAEKTNNDPLEVGAAIREMLSQSAVKTETTDEQFRYEEFRAFLQKPDKSYDPKDFLTAEESGYEVDGVEQVILVKKLREVRAQVGFTRISPSYGEDEEEEGTAKLVRVTDDAKKKWLPAYEVRGEGIFVKFDQKMLDTWASSEHISNRYARLVSKFGESIAHGVIAKLTPQFFLIHTFAHALVRQLGFECGYSSTALKERLYCSSSPGTEMAGVLIYTAGDSEGTLGGLVKQGEKKYFETIVSNAIKNLKWCSLDPLCAESPGQGFEATNLAACHACSMLFEASCEVRNCYLDRAALVGTIGNEEWGFFSKWLEGR